MNKRLALTTTVVAVVGLVPVAGAGAQLAPDPGGVGQFLPGDPGGIGQSLPQAKKVKQVKKATKLPYLGRH